MAQTYDLIAELPLRVDGYELDPFGVQINPEFERLTTVFRLRGAGEEGLGEDVTYSADDQRALREAGATLPLAGEWTIDSFSRHLEALTLFPGTPDPNSSTRYRTWAIESAGLDLALRQAGRALHDVLGREPRPLIYVNSLRLGEPPSLEPVRARLANYPGLRMKLDATSSWDDALVAELAATGAVDSIDLKGQYAGTIVDQPADPALYARVVDGFGGAWIEDPKLTDETEPILAAHHDRITWDAIIHTVADVEALPFAPRMVNVKPSRSGALRELFALYDACEARGIGAYGGGQTELSVGRGHIQLLASIFHPDTPNDVAPGAFNQPEPPPGLPTSPMVLRPRATGFALEG